jgi:hypothetical protein
MLPHGERYPLRCASKGRSAGARLVASPRVSHPGPRCSALTQDAVPPPALAWRQQLPAPSLPSSAGFLGPGQSSCLYLGSLNSLKSEQSDSFGLWRAARRLRAAPVPSRQSPARSPGEQVAPVLVGTALQRPARAGLWHRQPGAWARCCRRPQPIRIFLQS